MESFTVTAVERCYLVALLEFEINRYSSEEYVDDPSYNNYIQKRIENLTNILNKIKI